MHVRTEAALQNLKSHTALVLGVLDVSFAAALKGTQELWLGANSA